MIEVLIKEYEKLIINNSELGLVSKLFQVKSLQEYKETLKELDNKMNYISSLEPKHAPPLSPYYFGNHQKSHFYFSANEKDEKLIKITKLRSFVKDIDILLSKIYKTSEWKTRLLVLKQDIKNLGYDTVKLGIPDIII